MPRHGKSCLFAGICFLILCTAVRAQEEANWKRYLAAGNEATWHGRREQAEQMYRAALNEAERFGEADERLETSLRSLALTLKITGQLTKAHHRLVEAERLFVRLMNITIKNHSADHRDVGFILDEIAEVNLAQNKIPEAEASYSRALEIQRKNLARDKSFKNRSAYQNAINNLGKLFCAQGKFDEAETLDKKILPDCVIDKHEKEFLARYPKLSPPERVRLWLKAGGLWAYGAGREMESELIVRGLDAAPHLAEIVRRGKGDDRLAALKMLCDMDRFVSRAQLPERVEGRLRLPGENKDAGILDRVMIVDGRRIGKEGFAAVRWAAEQTQHDDLRFHAREYSGFLERDLRRLSLDEQITQWRTAAAKCGGAPGMNDDCALASQFEEILREKPLEVIQPLIDILERDPNSYVRKDAFDILHAIDSRSMRLRGTEIGRQAIEAMRRSLARCNLKPGYDKRKYCQEYWESVSAELYDDRSSAIVSDWLYALESIYGLQLMDKHVAVPTAEARQFTAFLTKLDPYFPSWEFAHHGRWTDYAQHPRFQAKWERYYEQWKRFKAETDTNKKQP
ncbi:MAG: tetratricopeptide repeat protein [Pyrinomonadaceae bacterium]|nr:tetratricopeptide repeat protein [Pyrinomonadaceae bacterium]